MYASEMTSIGNYISAYAMARVGFIFIHAHLFG